MEQGGGDILEIVHHGVGVFGKVYDMPHLHMHHEVEYLLVYMVQRQERDGLVNFVHLRDLQCLGPDPQIVLMRDHGTLGRSCGT